MRTCALGRGACVRARRACAARASSRSELMRDRIAASPPGSPRERDAVSPSDHRLRSSRCSPLLTPEPNAASDDDAGAPLHAGAASLLPPLSQLAGDGSVGSGHAVAIGPADGAHGANGTAHATVGATSGATLSVWAGSWLAETAPQPLAVAHGSARMAHTAGGDGTAAADPTTLDIVAGIFSESSLAVGAATTSEEAGTAALSVTAVLFVEDRALSANVATSLTPLTEWANCSLTAWGSTSIGIGAELSVETSPSDEQSESLGWAS
eukprot:6195746-Pleurochrysis_carterae.AAC.3